MISVPKVGNTVGNFLVTNEHFREKKNTMNKRVGTTYPGVYYRLAKRVGKKGNEKVYYVVFKKQGTLLEEKVGRQYVDDMTPARAAGIRAERIEGKRLSRREIKQNERALKEQESDRWTINRLWMEYTAGKPSCKSLATDENRYKNYIKPLLGEREPSEIIPLEIHRMRINLLKKKTPQTVRHVLTLLKRIVHFGVRKGLCDSLPFSIEMPRVHNLKTEDLTPDQMARLFKAIEKDTHPHAGNMMKMTLYTGMRRGELFKLKWDHIDFERGFISIVDPKGGPDQKIPMNDMARTLLESHQRSDSPFVFPGRGGRQRTDINKHVNKIKNKAGLPKDFRPLHGLRHVYASMLASSGEVDMYTLQKLLTHKSPLMTQRYAHLRDEALKRASDLAGNLIAEVVNGMTEEEESQTV